MGNPWEPNFYPQWIWDLAANVVFLAGSIAAVLVLWKYGPELLIKYGWNWMTTLGESWGERRKKEH